MIPIGFLALAVAFSLTGLTFYVADTLRGRTQPNRVTWALWALAPLVAFAAEVDEGVGPVAIMTLLIGIGPLVVVAASFVDRRGYARLTRFDLACGGLSVLALVAWQITGSGNVAILFSVLADLLAAAPTVRKSYLRPESETWKAFLCSAISASITLLTISDWTFAAAAFPAYLLGMSGTLFILVRFPGWRPHRVAA